MNDFEFSDVANILVGDGSLVDLPRTLPAPERYTYVFEGNSQVLDHILISRALADPAGRRDGYEYDIVHTNSEFARPGVRPRPPDRAAEAHGPSGACPPRPRVPRARPHTTRGRVMLDARDRSEAPQHDSESSEPLGPLTPDGETPLGDTPEAHDEISPHDLPPDHPGRAQAEREAGRTGTTRGNV